MSRTYAIDDWTIPLSADLGLVDCAFAARLKTECASGDREGDGCHADRILGELLRKLGMTATAEAYASLNIWRA